MFPPELQTAPFAGRLIKTAAGCWVYTGARNQNDYGAVSFKSYGTSVAHRLSYTRCVGPIPEGLQLDHLCRVRPCVRPSHLEPVTMLENISRGFVGWINNPNALKSHCKHGHPFDGENTAIEVYRGKTQRRCRTCDSSRQKAKAA